MPVRVEGIPEAIANVTKDIEDSVRTLGINIFQAVVSGTPVDTGYARGNWFVDFASENLRTRGSRESPPGVPTAGQIETWQINAGNLIIHNSVEYIVFLDQGSSAQAPQGIVDPAIAAAVR